jgi:hypothetical protein
MITQSLPVVQLTAHEEHLAFDFRSELVIYTTPEVPHAFFFGCRDVSFNTIKPTDVCRIFFNLSH